MIAIVDYGLGNLGSIQNMLKVIGEKSKITGREEEIRSSDGLILPGVGAFDAGMSRLTSSGLSELLRRQAAEGKPILGICLGMQLLGRESEEGSLPGLSLLPFVCRRFRPEDPTLRVPHMGWDVVEFKKEHPLLDHITGQQRYYFVHSYHAVCDDPDDILMTCRYGCEFAAAVGRENVLGVQFHPEKSHFFGLALLSNFVKICHGGITCSADRESSPRC